MVFRFCKNRLIFKIYTLSETFLLECWYVSGTPFFLQRCSIALFCATITVPAAVVCPTRRLVWRCIFVVVTCDMR